MTIKFVGAKNTEIETLEQLIKALEESKMVKIFHNDSLIQTLKFGKGRESKLTFAPHILIHSAIIPKNLKTVIEWLEGDAHARSKVQFYSPKHGVKSFF